MRISDIDFFGRMLFLACFADVAIKWSMSFFSSISLPEEQFAVILKAERRRRGMTQGQLANLLGIKQANISRWESGKEPVPRVQRLCLIDVFENKGGRITPILERMIRRDPSISIQSIRDDRILRESPEVLNAFKLQRSDIEGAEHARVYDVRWKASQPEAEEFVSLDYHRDIFLNPDHGASVGYRMHIELFMLELEHNQLVAIRRNLGLWGATGEDVNFKAVQMVSDFD